MKIELPEELEGMEILATLLSPDKPEIGVLVLGEDYQEKSNQPVIRVYLINMYEEEWVIQDELQAFAFWSFESAKRFVDDLPSMSAIDLMLLMNGHSKDMLNEKFLQ